jgi:hypothetical protein
MLSLSPTKKWMKMREDPLKKGDVVLLRDDNLAKNDWKLARVETVHHGKDNLIRMVDLRIPSGSVIRRHLNKLALLEEDMSCRPVCHK